MISRFMSERLVHLICFFRRSGLVLVGEFELIYSRPNQNKPKSKNCPDDRLLVHLPIENRHHHLRWPELFRQRGDLENVDFKLFFISRLAKETSKNL